MKEWVKMPSKVFMDELNSPLLSLKWQGDQKSDYIAALMLFIVLAHHANDGDSHHRGNLGHTYLSYEQLRDITGISKSKISKGLQVLESVQLIHRVMVGRANVYEIRNYSNQGGWAKLPAKGLYDKSTSVLKAFANFKLRNKVELNALKIYLVIISFRGNTTNFTQLSYEKISSYSAVQRNDIRSALSFLVANQMINVDSSPTSLNDYSTSNIYRLSHLESRRHRAILPI